MKRGLRWMESWTGGSVPVVVNWCTSPALMTKVSPAPVAPNVRQPALSDR